MARIVIHEVGPRDGLQMEKQVVPIERKEAWIRGVLAAGVDIVQVGSFVHPEKVPQMADTDELFRRLAAGKPAGATLSRDGYRLAFPVVRRVVATDFVTDRGVPFIWAAGAFLLLALLVWLPTRLLFPRREMLFVQSGTVVRAYSRAAGRGRRHAGVFHELLDVIAAEGGG